MGNWVFIMVPVLLLAAHLLNKHLRRKIEQTASDRKRHESRLDEDRNRLLGDDRPGEIVRLPVVLPGRNSSDVRISEDQVSTVSLSSSSIDTVDSIDDVRMLDDLSTSSSQSQPNCETERVVMAPFGEKPYSHSLAQLITPHKSTLVNRFKEKNIHLYHFTDRANCFSIEQCGAILPMKEIKLRGIAPNFVSSDFSRYTDTRDGRDGFIHLAFHPDHKMSYSARDRSTMGLAIYRIYLEVLDRPGVTFSRGLANKTGQVQIDIQDISDDDLRAIVRRSDEVRYWQLLVPDAITIEFLRLDRILPRGVQRNGNEETSVSETR